jgi:hypothetical protein
MLLTMGRGRLVGARRRGPVAGCRRRASAAGRRRAGRRCAGARTTALSSSAAGSDARSSAADAGGPARATGRARPAKADGDAFSDFHLAKALEACYSWPEADAAVQKCVGLAPAAFVPLLGDRSTSKLATLLALARCRPEPCRTAADLLLWLVDRRVVKRADLEPWRAAYKGQTARDVAERVIQRFRPEEGDGAAGGGAAPADAAGGAAAQADAEPAVSVPPAPLCAFEGGPFLSFSPLLS